MKDEILPAEVGEFVELVFMYTIIAISFLYSNFMVLHSSQILQFLIGEF